MRRTLPHPRLADRDRWAAYMATVDASPSEVAAACGVSRQAASAWLCGRSIPVSAESAVALADAVARPELVTVWRACRGGVA